MSTMYIVMTAAAKMPSSCWGNYRRVAVVKVLTYDYNRGNGPKQINSQHKACLRVVDLGHHSVGKTERCAYAQALKRAKELAYRLNNARDLATVDDIIGAGGSA
jgi:hypothetical protein